MQPEQPQPQDQKQIKILLAQLKPILKQKKQNIERVKKSLLTYTSKDKIDIVMFP